MITHDLDTIWEVTDRVAFLGEGKFLENKPIAELYRSQHSLIQNYFANYRARNELSYWKRENFSSTFKVNINFRV